MATDFYLKIQGIEGESEKAGHEKEIEIQSFSFGATNHGTFHSGGKGGGGGKAEITDISVVKQVDKASPLLFKACASGDHIGEATIYSQKTGGPKPVTYYEIKMTDLIVSSHNNNGSNGGDAVYETIVFNCSRVDFVYTPQDNKGGAGSSVRAFFDIRAAKAG